MLPVFIGLFLIDRSNFLIDRSNFLIDRSNFLIDRSVFNSPVSFFDCPVCFDRSVFNSPVICRLFQPGGSQGGGAPPVRSVRLVSQHNKKWAEHICINDKFGSGPLVTVLPPLTFSVGGQHSSATHRLSLFWDDDFITWFVIISCFNCNS